MSMLRVMMVLLAAFFQQNAATVEGVVARSDTNEGIAEARVLFARTDGRLADSIVVTCDEKGRFKVESLPPGVYRVFAEHDGYVRSGSSVPLAIAPGQRIQSLSIVIVPTGVVTGRVVNEVGDPAPKIYVRAITSHVVAETRTNDLGEYRLFGLPPDAYVISAERYPGPSIDDGTQGPRAGRGPSYVMPTPPCPDCLGEGRGTIGLAVVLGPGEFIDPLALTGQGYPPVFYPGTTDRASATPLDVKAGAQLSGIDLQLVIATRVR